MTDACVKNTGDHFLIELASREFVDQIVALSESKEIEAVQTRARTLFQVWALAMGQDERFRYIREAYEQCRREGVSFPQGATSTPLQALYRTKSPPEWADSAQCVRCRVPFTVLNRKHHCRNCGQTFCQDCSSKTMALPDFGLYEDVRVCETCYAQRFQVQIRAATVKEEPPEDDLAKAIRLSLEAKPSPSSASAREPYDEEKALADAIAASLKDTGHQPSPGTTKPEPNADLPSAPAEPDEEADHMVLTLIEKENIRLFSQLVSQLSENEADEVLEALAEEMRQIKSRIHRHIVASNFQVLPEMSRNLSILDAALQAFDGLHQDSIDPLSVPTRPRSSTGSIVQYPSPQKQGGIANNFESGLIDIEHSEQDEPNGEEEREEKEEILLIDI